MRFCWWMLGWLLLLGVVVCAARGQGPVLRAVETRYYVIHTDVSQGEAREAGVRMTRMVEEYSRRTSGFSGKIEGRLPVYLYRNLADYTAAVGVRGTGGFFDGEKLMAATLREKDGTIAAATWHIVQHEGFHQFAQAVIGGEAPMWADEGLAEYFGEGVFTGDGFVTGLIPQERLVRVRKMLAAKSQRPFREFLSMTREGWNAKVEMANYDQAWSLVHFLAHGEEGRLQKAFVRFMQDVGKGEQAEKAFNRDLNSIPKLEERWRAWWLGLGDDPTAELYAQGTLAGLTSFLARAHARGERFAAMEDFLKRPAGEMKQGEEDWLPESLFVRSVSEARRLEGRGARFVLVKAVDRPPAIVLTLANGTKLAGRFGVSGEGRVEGVRVEVVVRGAVGKPDEVRMRGR